MRKMMLFFVVLMCLCSSAMAEGSQVGRYQIVINPQASKYTFLLDTQTGMVFQLVLTKEGVLGWQTMEAVV